jgi:hypothetical protein
MLQCNEGTTHFFFFLSLTLHLMYVATNMFFVEMLRPGARLSNCII